MKRIPTICLTFLTAFFLMSCSGISVPTTPGGTATAVTQGATENATTGLQAGFQEQVLYDGNDVLVKATSLNTDGASGPDLVIYVQNKSDMNISVKAGNVSVNGYMITPVFSSRVPAGQASSDVMMFLQERLDVCGIDVIADITFNLFIFETGTYVDIVRTDPITVTTSAASAYTQTYDDSGAVLYDQDGVRIVYKGAQGDSWIGPSYLFYIANDMDRSLTIQTEDVTVNGISLNPLFSCDIVPGKVSLCTMDFHSSDMEDNNIEKVQDIEMKFVLYDMDTYRRIAQSGTVTLSP